MERDSGMKYCGPCKKCKHITDLRFECWYCGIPGWPPFDVIEGGQSDDDDVDPELPQSE